MNNRIRKIRKSLGMTQEEFSNALGLSRNFISQIESGTKNPSNRTKTISVVYLVFRRNG